jgi:hypothetical protein
MAKLITINSLSNDRAKFLNTLSFLKEHSIVAVNTQWMSTGETFCELYSRKTKKRVKFITSITFKNPEFINNPNEYIRNKKIYTRNYH